MALSQPHGSWTHVVWEYLSISVSLFSGISFRARYHVLPQLLLSFFSLVHSFSSSSRPLQRPDADIFSAFSSVTLQCSKILPPPFCMYHQVLKIFLLFILFLPRLLHCFSTSLSYTNTSLYTYWNVWSNWLQSPYLLSFHCTYCVSL